MTQMEMYIVITFSQWDIKKCRQGMDETVMYPYVHSSLDVETA